jgi:hypothetical protein
MEDLRLRVARAMMEDHRWFHQTHYYDERDWLGVADAVIAVIKDSAKEDLKETKGWRT